jgi:hypothetical protein
MRVPRTALLLLTAASVALVPALSGCGSRLDAPTAPRVPAPSAKGATEPSAVTSAADCAPASPFDAANFTSSTRVNNRWYPLVPGTQYILEGRADRGGGPLPHQVILTVTDLVKTVRGARAVVLWDRDVSDGELVEAELAFHAQDNRGNVWNLGEYPEQYEGGVFTGAPSTWISGLGGAEGGIIVEGNPVVGDKFLQGYVPDITFLDCARVEKMGETTCVPTGCYDNVLVVAERSPLEPGSGTQLKYYAPGVGNVRIGAVGDKENETLVLIQVTRLGTQALREARREALRLEKHAYQVSPVYQLTAPMQ